MANITATGRDNSADVRIEKSLGGTLMFLSIKAPTVDVTVSMSPQEMIDLAMNMLVNAAEQKTGQYHEDDNESDLDFVCRVLSK